MILKPDHVVFVPDDSSLLNMTDIVLDTVDLDEEEDVDVLEELDNSVILIIILILAILFLLGTVANTTLLMAFFRRPTLRTTSNR